MDNLDNIFSESLQGEDFGHIFDKTFDFLGLDQECLGLGTGDSMAFSANDIIEQCDIVGFDFEQLTDLGLDDNAAFTLSLNQAGIHHALDTMPDCSGWSAARKVYTENFMTGVTATVHDINIAKLDGSVDSVHAGDFRALSEGEEFAQDFIDRYGTAPSFEECKKHIEATVPQHNVSIKGHSQAEIDSKYHKAEVEHGHAKADYRRHMDLANTGTMPNNDELAHAREAHRRMEAAEKEMNKWRHTHPDK